MVAPAPVPAPASAPRSRIWPRNPTAAAVTMLAFTAVLYLIELIDQVTPLNLDQNGIVPRSLSGLDGVLWAPLLHMGWGHLIANTLPFLIFGFLALAGGVGQFVMVTATIWLLSGFGVWLTAPDGATTVGMSGVIFGWLVFLLARGVFARSWTQILLAVPLFLLWGGMLFGVLPTRPDVSWQGHLFGALAGLLAAYIVARADRGSRPAGMIPG